MLHLVAYDICQPKRLRLVAKTCEDYGVRIEKSVFECDLPEDRYAAFWKALLRVIDPEEDALVSYRICQSCAAGIQSAGTVRRPPKRLLYLF